MEQLDLVVIGAGWHGLAAAKTYLQLNPEASVALLDSGSTIGGVWSKERHYPGLQSNNLLGTYEYSDFPMNAETYGLQPMKAVPAHVIHRYLSDYAEQFGVSSKVRFQTKVESAEHQKEGGWVLALLKAGRDGGFVSSQILASKLIVATGMTSDPAKPMIDGMETFGVPLFHPKDVLVYEATLATARRVCVYGGSKSACDAVYAFGSSGVQVDWVIRESGHGPAWMAPPFVTPLKRWLETLPHTRLLTWFSPCIWGDADGYSTIRNLFHNTAIGRWIVNAFWGILASDVVTLNKYDASPELAKLKPWTNPMFVASSIGILNYKTDLYDLVRNGIAKVHIADIVSLGPKTVQLSTGEALPSDALVACTGWKSIPPINFFSKDFDLGLPTFDSSTATHLKLTQRADKEIFTRFPRLRDQPSPNPKLKPRQVAENDEHLSSYNLYRFMIPPSSTKYRDIAFSGAQMSFSTPLLAQLQALWISAYFSLSPNLLLPSSSETIEYEAVLHNRFGKWRYPQGFGERHPDFVFDAVPYIDLLLRDLGLERWRKNGRLAEWLVAYGPKDYRGLVDEFQGLEAGRKDSGRRKDL